MKTALSYCMEFCDPMDDRSLAALRDLFERAMADARRAALEEAIAAVKAGFSDFDDEEAASRIRALLDTAPSKEADAVAAAVAEKEDHCGPY